MSSDRVLERLTALHPKLIDLCLGRIERSVDDIGEPIVDGGTSRAARAGEHAIQQVARPAVRAGRQMPIELRSLGSSQRAVEIGGELGLGVAAVHRQAP